MSWPITDKKRQGLLPDSFDLRKQVGAGPAINPGTVQAHLPELYEKGKLYDIKKLRNRGWFVHAPCTISDIREGKSEVTFTVDGWGAKQYFVLVCGVEKEPSEVGVREIYREASRAPAFESAVKQFHSEQNLLIIALKGKSQIRIR
jgi:hypothetical protein